MKKLLNIIHGQLSKGCQLCLKGFKSVLFITGICRIKCPYCPVSRDRFGKDVVYINEIPVNKIEDIFKEIETCLSYGIAITGGEPLEVIDRVIKVTKMLKNVYGEDFHIHMYINIQSLTEIRLEKLKECKIDELRIHTLSINQILSKIEMLKNLKDFIPEIILEVPVIPHFKNEIIEIIKLLYENEIVKYINLNEVDITESNYEYFVNLGYKIEFGGSLIGSLDCALEIMNKITKYFPKININICKSKTKDIIQICSRLYRRNFIDSKCFEYVLEDGLLLQKRINNRVIHPLTFIRGKALCLKVYRDGIRSKIFEEFEC